MVPRANIWLLLLLLSFPFGRTRAQEVSWGLPQKVSNKTNYAHILGANESSVFLLRSRDSRLKESIYFEKYRSSLGLERTEKMQDLPGLRSYFVNAFVKDNGLFVFKMGYNFRSNRNELHLQWMDNDLKVRTAPRKILEVDANQMGDENSFYIRHHPEKNIYLITYIDKASGINRVNMAITNDSADIISYRRYSLPENADYADIRQICMTNEGVPVIITTGKNREQKRTSQYEFRIFSLFRDTVFSIILPQEGRQISTFDMSYDRKSDRIVLSGLCYDNREKPSKNFYFISHFEPRNLTQTKDIIQPIPEDLMLKMGGEKKSDEVQNYDLVYSIPRSDGGCILLLEKAYQSQQSYTYMVNGIPQYAFRTIYNYEEVLVWSLNPDGSMDWKTILNKNQSSVADGGYYSSFIPVILEEKIVLLYNDVSRNSGDVYLFSINYKGETDQRLLFKGQNMMVFMAPTEARQITYNTIICGAVRDRKFSLLKLVF